MNYFIDILTAMRGIAVSIMLKGTLHPDMTPRRAMRRIAVSMRSPLVYIRESQTKSTVYGIRARTKKHFTCKPMVISAKFNYAARYPGQQAS